MLSGTLAERAWLLDVRRESLLECVCPLVGRCTPGAGSRQIETGTRGIGRNLLRNVSQVPDNIPHPFPIILQEQICENQDSGLCQISTRMTAFAVRTRLWCTAIHSIHRGRPKEQCPENWQFSWILHFLFINISCSDQKRHQNTLSVYCLKAWLLNKWGLA